MDRLMLGDHTVGVINGPEIALAAQADRLRGGETVHVRGLQAGAESACGAGDKSAEACGRLVEGVGGSQ